MSKPRRRSSTPRQYQRTARLGELLREIIAEDLERIGDERLELVAITTIDVDQELNRAIVFYDALRGADADAEVLAAFGEHRIRLQASIARQIHARKTPILEFRPDNVLRSAERIDQIIRENPLPERPADPDPDVDLDLDADDGDRDRTGGLDDAEPG